MFNCIKNMNVMGGLSIARRIAVLDTSRRNLAENTARTTELSRRFTPEMPNAQHVEIHPLKLALARALAPRSTLPRNEPSQLAVTRMAAILKAAEQNRGKPLGQIFKRRN
ncbi:MAG: hypothetical protein Q8R15_01245 [Candidatus Micrarchaeota archaeon]|nr:hypothetical protein [Candidatus Micrarchaeota archaeon]